MNHSSTPSRRASRRLRMIVLAMVAMLLSGCTMRTLIGIDVEEDGSGTFEMTMAFDEDMRTLLEQDSPEPIDWSDPASFEGDDSPASLIDEMPEGGSVEAYSEDGFEGFTVSVDFASLDELNGVLSEAESQGEGAFPFTITSDGEGSFELVGEGELFESAELSEEETEFLPPEVLGNLFDIQFRVKLPGEVTSTNADETTDDGVMVWRIDPLSSDPVIPAAASEASGSSSSVALIVGIVAVVAIVAGFLVFRRNRGDAEAPESTEPSAPEESEEEPVS